MRFHMMLRDSPDQVKEHLHNQPKSDFLSTEFLHVTLDLMGKHCPIIFPMVWLSFSRNNACKNAGFLEPVLAANAHFTDSICLHRIMLFVENEREPSEQK